MTLTQHFCLIRKTRIAIIARGQRHRALISDPIKGLVVGHGLRSPTLSLAIRRHFPPFE